MTASRAATNTPISRARYPFTDMRTSSSQGADSSLVVSGGGGPVEPGGVDGRGPGGLDAAVDTWDRERYGRFAAERAQPFHDLLGLVRPVPGGRVVDLGCGGGELTAQLHRRLGAAETLGLDNSPAMLERAAELAGGGLRFELRDIAGFGGGGWDVIFSNAALHWLPDHAALLSRLVAALGEGGQLAVQLPANHDHPSHLVAAEVAGTEPFRSALGGYRRESPVQAPEWYAELLDRLGLEAQHVRLLGEVDLAGGGCLLGQAGHDVGGFLQTRVVGGVAFEDLRQDPIEPNELRVVELREFPGHPLADAFGPASRKQDPPVSLSLHHPR